MDFNNRNKRMVDELKEMIVECGFSEFFQRDKYFFELLQVYERMCCEVCDERKRIDDMRSNFTDFTVKDTAIALLDLIPNNEERILATSLLFHLIESIWLRYYELHKDNHN
jgi:hypothetical protein